MSLLRPLTVGAFVSLVVLSNLLTDHFGLVELPFGLAVTAGTFTAGAVLLARDALSEVASALLVLGAILLGAGVSWVTSSPSLALASAVAFLLAELIDWGVYAPLRRRGWGRAVLTSSLIAAPVDTAIFLYLAGFPLTVGAVTGQTVVKVALAALVVLAGKGVAGAVLRHRIEPGNS